MHALISAFGSRGDIQPMIALALGLRRAGHTVTFAAPPNFATWVQSFELKFVPVGTDVQAAFEEVGFSVPKAMQAMKDEAHKQFTGIEALADGVDAFIGASIHCASVSMGERCGVPSFYAFFAPQIPPSRHHPPPFMTTHGLPQWANALCWSGMRVVSNRLFRPVMNEDRVRVGLPTIDDAWAHLLGPNPLFAGDAALATIPPDTGTNVVTTGPWLLPETDALSPALEAFLNEGPPPVYIGFGSMPDAHPERTTKLILEAVQDVGTRAIISSGWARLGGVEVPASVKVIGGAPHGKLFPRCSAIVHHGGAGTTTAAANAGVPQLLVPHAFDQFHWARLIPALGVAPKSIPKTRLNARNLAAALRVCLQDELMQRRAKELETRTTRNGVERAVAHIERVVAEFRPAASWIGLGRLYGPTPFGRGPNDPPRRGRLELRSCW